VVLVIDVQGARQVRNRGLENVGIFVLPPSAAILEQRLRGRSKDSEEQIRRRLDTACSEVGDYALY
jgi:guanylate kinase